MSPETLQQLIESMQNCQEILTHMDNMTAIVDQPTLELVFTAPVPRLDDLHAASCYPPPDPDPTKQPDNELAEVQILHAIACARFSDASAAGCATTALSKEVRTYVQRKIGMGDLSVDAVPPRQRHFDAGDHLISRRLYPLIRPLTPLDSTASRSQALYWVCFLTAKVLSLLELQPYDRPQDQWADTMATLQQAWQFAEAAAPLDVRDLNTDCTLAMLRDNYYLWLAYGVPQSSPGAEVFIAECNVFYLWLVLQGSSFAPPRRPHFPAILDPQTPALATAQGNGDIDMLSAGGGDWDPAPSDHNSETSGGGDQRQRRMDDFVAKKPLLLQRLLMLRGSTMDHGQPCIECGGENSVLYCTECEGNLCVDCDHTRHRLQGLHRRHALHSGATLAALETVQIDSESNVSSLGGFLGRGVSALYLTPLPPSSETTRGTC